MFSISNIFDFKCSVLIKNKAMLNIEDLVVLYILLRTFNLTVILQFS